MACFTIVKTYIWAIFHQNLGQFIICNFLLAFLTLHLKYISEWWYAEVFGANIAQPQQELPRETWESSNKPQFLLTDAANYSFLANFVDIFP